MNKPKIFLTSIVAIMLVAPSFATVGETNFETNQTGVSSCEIGVLGVDENTANADAQWSVNKYTCIFGTYLPAGNNWTSDNQYLLPSTANGLERYECAPCQSGSYCLGTSFNVHQNVVFTYSATQNQGLTSCPVAYPNSDTGAEGEYDCYRTCTASDVAHLKSGGTVTGRFYSNGGNMCAPSDSNQCAGGYHYVAGTTTLPNLPNLISDSNTPMAFIDGGYITDDGSYSENESNFGLTENGTFGLDFGSEGKIIGKSVCSTLNPQITGTTGIQEYYKNGELNVKFSTSAYVPDNKGPQCWCQLTGYIPNNGTLQTFRTDWVFRGDMDGDGAYSSCNEDCAYYCISLLSGTDFGQNLESRYAFFDSVSAVPAQCVANTITLNWKNAIGGTHATTQCTYGGTIDTPTTAPTKRGHTFTGWRFVAPSGN